MANEQTYDKNSVKKHQKCINGGKMMFNGGVFGR